MSPLGFLVAFIILLPLGIAATSLAPWVPTAGKDVKRIHQLSHLQPGETFYDLGCGEGRVCRYMAKHNPEAQVIGIELAWPLYVVARCRQWIRPFKNLRYIRGNALHQNLSNADVVYVYGLIRTMNEKVKPTLLKNMKPGARAISYHFQMHDWPGTHTTNKPTNNDVPLHVYTVKYVK